MCLCFHVFHVLHVYHLLCYHCLPPQEADTPYELPGAHERREAM